MFLNWKLNDKKIILTKTNGKIIVINKNNISEKDFKANIKNLTTIVPGKEIINN